MRICIPFLIDLIQSYILTYLLYIFVYIHLYFIYIYLFIYIANHRINTEIYKNIHILLKIMHFKSSTLMLNYMYCRYVCIRKYSIQIWLILYLHIISQHSIKFHISFMSSSISNGREYQSFTADYFVFRANSFTWKLEDIDKYKRINY